LMPSGTMAYIVSVTHRGELFRPKLKLEFERSTPDEARDELRAVFSSLSKDQRPAARVA
jgi:hypothetical protein